MDAEELVRKMMNSVINEDWEPIDMVVATTILNRAAYDTLKRETPDIFEMSQNAKNKPYVPKSKYENPDSPDFVG